MTREPSGLYDETPRAQVRADLVRRSRARLDGMPPAALDALLEDALFHERKRLERATAPDDERRLDRLAAALVRGGRSERTEAALAIVDAWGEEIHGRFDPRVYRVATRILPRGLTALLSRRPDRLRDWRFADDPLANPRLKVYGDLPLLQQLSREATLVLVPTHVSNLDSPLIGLALYLAGLPPFTYGAGLNLFSNPVVGWWMARLGAYTVDRSKRAQLYKDVLKDYSVRCLTTRRHSLFFPGGTRSRSHEVEPKLKKGLLGTGLAAWQEMLAAGRPDADVYFVPLTLSYTLVLEAATLIEDHLEEAGKQRYVITDDEFAQPRRLAAFARRVLDLDAAVVAHFGAPLDVLGRPVPADAAERATAAVRRRGYVCDRDGTVQRDEQRDHVYTDRLGQALVAAWPRYAHVLPTHLAARAAWRCLEAAEGTNDPFRLVRIPAEKRRIRGDLFRDAVAAERAALAAGAAAGRWRIDSLPDDPQAIVDTALDRFGCYHRSRALAASGSDVVVEDPKLCLFYQNRLSFVGREP